MSQKNEFKTQVGVPNLVCPRVKGITSCCHTFPRIISKRIYCHSKCLEHFSIECRKTKISYPSRQTQRADNTVSQSKFEVLKARETCAKTVTIGFGLPFDWMKIGAFSEVSAKPITFRLSSDYHSVLHC